MSGAATLARQSARHWARHPWQLALSVLGVALGVAVALGVDLANASSLRAMRLAAEAAGGRATHRVVGGELGIDEALYTALRVDVGARPSAPVVERDLALPDHPGEVLRLLGLDPFAEAPFRPYVGAVGGEGDLTAFLTRPGACLLGRPTAERLDVGLGERLRVRVDAGVEALTVVGLVEAGDGLERRRLADVLVVDVATAQALLGTPGRLSRVDLIAPAGADAERAFLGRVRAVLPDGVRVESAGARAGTLERLTRGFRLNLQALALLAVVVGGFLIFNTLRFGVVQRRESIGTLRTLGASRRQLVALVLAEAAALGAVGTAIGTLLGVALAGGLVGLVAQTIGDLYFALQVREVALEPWPLAKAWVLGLGAALVAAAGPAREATGAPPRSVQRRSLAEETAARGARGSLLLGLAGIALGAVALFLSDRSLFLAYAGLFGVVIGAALLVPAACRVVLPLAVAPLRAVFGTVGALAARGASASLSRTGVAVAALAVALSSSLGVTVLVSSFRGTVVAWLDKTLAADVYASPPSLVNTRSDATLDPETVDHVLAAEGVARGIRYRGREVPGPGDEPVYLVATEATRADLEPWAFLQGSLDAAWEAFDAGRGVLVSEPLAWRLRVGVGDALRVDAPSGPTLLPVLAVYHDYGRDRGVANLRLDAYRALFDDDGVSTFAAVVEPGADVDAVVAAMRARVPEGVLLSIRPNRSLREETFVVFDRTFAVTGVLRLLTLGVALVGVASALLAIALERGRELAVLRAVGLGPGQVVGLVSTECGLLGLAAGLFAIPLGAAMAWIMVYVVNRRAFGWTLLEFDLSPAIVGTTVGLGVLAAVAAGLYPALRMARTQPASALRVEG